MISCQINEELYDKISGIINLDVSAMYVLRRGDVPGRQKMLTETAQIVIQALGGLSSKVSPGKRY